MQPYKNDRLMILTGFEQDKNFMFAENGIENLKVFNPQ